MIKRIWNRLFHRSEPQPAPASTQLETLLRALNEDAAAHLNCEEVFELVDQYAESASCGEDLRRLMPLVHEHLEHCPDCREEYEALMRMLESQEN